VLELCAAYLLLTTYYLLLTTYYRCSSCVRRTYYLLRTTYYVLPTTYYLLQVLELCAAPGGKSTHLAEIMGDAGRVLSVEASEY
jgi:hypothetical protein